LAARLGSAAHRASPLRLEEKQPLRRALRARSSAFRGRGASFSRAGIEARFFSSLAGRETDGAFVVADARVRGRLNITSILVDPGLFHNAMDGPRRSACYHVI